MMALYKNILRLSLLRCFNPDAEGPLSKITTLFIIEAVNKSVEKIVNMYVESRGAFTDDYKGCKKRYTSLITAIASYLELFVTQLLKI